MAIPHVVVIGSGIGGLTAAALLQQYGYQVTVLEAQAYPGGCASTFFHRGFRFDSGATVAGGFQPNGPHAIVGQILQIDWPIHLQDPAWITHLPDRSVSLTRNNRDIFEKFPQSKALWDKQCQLADVAWKLSANVLPWPPGDPPEFVRLLQIGLAHFPDIRNVSPFVLLTVYQWLRNYGLHTDQAFVRFIDSQLLISAQATSRQVHALYGAVALDLARQGVYHVEGGIGTIAQALITRFLSLGGAIRYRHKVTKIVVKNDRVTGIECQRGRHSKSTDFIETEFVIANLTPWNLANLLKGAILHGLSNEYQQCKPGWGAFVLHLGIDNSAFPADFSDHHQIITTMDGPLGETHSVFMSLSPQWDHCRAPAGQRAVTISTHTNTRPWWDMLDSDPVAYDLRKDDYTHKILAAINRIIPGFQEHITLILPGTPVTYQYYTGRYRGTVGGCPQTSLFKVRGPHTGISNLRLVGDSIFPGQSTAGVTLGAMRVVQGVKRFLGDADLGVESYSVQDRSYKSEPWW